MLLSSCLRIVPSTTFSAIFIRTAFHPGSNLRASCGNNLTNPDENGNPVPVSIGTDFHQPYPDPGEEFDHITAQLFSALLLQTPRRCKVSLRTTSMF